MTKNRIISFLLFLCFAILAGHDMVPHHHHDEDHHVLDTGHHSDADHDDDHEEDNLINIFSYITHSGNILVLISHNPVSQFKIEIKSSLIITDFISFIGLKPDIPRIIPPSFSIILPEFNSASAHLRAPPSFLV